MTLAFRLARAACQALICASAGAAFLTLAIMGASLAR